MRKGLHPSRLAWLGLVAVVAVVLSACGSSSGSPSTTPGSSSQNPSAPVCWHTLTGARSAGRARMHLRARVTL
jgi:hypothetical protein